MFDYHLYILNKQSRDITTHVSNFLCFYEPKQLTNQIKGLGELWNGSSHLFGNYQPDSDDNNNFVLRSYEYRFELKLQILLYKVLLKYLVCYLALLPAGLKYF